MRTQVTVRVPAHARFVATTRVAVASLAAEFDFTIEEIEGLRVGVDELVMVLVEWAEDHGCEEVELVCLVDGDTDTVRGDPDARAIEVRGSVVGGLDLDGSVADDSPDLDFLTKQILTGVVDEHHIEGPTGRLIKRHNRP